MDDIELTKKQGRGQRAEDLLKNELLQDTFKYLHDEYIATWKRTSVKDVAAREALYIATNIVGKVQEQLHKYAADGRLSAKELARIKYPKP